MASTLWMRMSDPLRGAWSVAIAGVAVQRVRCNPKVRFAGIAGLNLFRRRRD
jgi:hypothetical protein